MLNTILIILSFLTVSCKSAKTSQLNMTKKSSPDFSENARIAKGEDRSNIYRLPYSEHIKAVDRGRRAALVYPVLPTGMTPPYSFMKKGVDAQVSGVSGFILNPFLKAFSPWKGEAAFYDWVGLTPYPENYRSGSKYKHSGLGPYILPPKYELDTEYLGSTLLNYDGDKALTFACGACHLGNLFGRPVLGLSNKLPSAFDFMSMGVEMTKRIHPSVIETVGGLSKGEKKLLKNTYEAAQFIRTVPRIHQSLDTSLAIVGLSLSKRAEDKIATRDPKVAQNPRYNPLEHHSVDSKPSVWWNLKYKTRWLSDGSVVSGNPIFTNILWNEIGRGSDLEKIDDWLDENKNTVEDLTAFVFATEAPRYTDFFDDINVEKAEKGRILFNENCSSCHGSYEKTWQNINPKEWGNLPLAELISTARVNYHEKTPVVNVGTDPNRYQGMKYFAEDLNRLKISKKYGTVVKPQRGYVPPPLVGIWARWPYFHNSSVTSLCDVLTPGEKRQKQFYVVRAKNKETDFDKDCVGLPSPEELKNRSDAVVYDATKHGMNNTGHDQGILLKDGEEIFSSTQKMDIIEFLKTL